ncbi:DNA breaking-rejoining protein [Cereibacter sphaeroides f. sp. denitrificans]|nr:DNA breaking-rejoining protein [Cereibacter sphaeroides f. sp. denitrificans]
MTYRKLTRLVAVLLMIGGAPAMADDIRRETVHFAPGTSGSTINARIKGYNSVQYSLGVRAGQKMSVQLDSNNASLYFNITAPGATEALYNSSIDGNGTSVTIPSSGTYVIDVYLMRNAARWGETANYSLTLYVE